MKRKFPWGALGQRVRMWREKVGKTEQEVATILGEALPHYMAFERGDMPPGHVGTTKWRDLAPVMGVEVNDLFSAVEVEYQLWRDASGKLWSANKQVDEVKR